MSPGQFIQLSSRCYCNLCVTSVHFIVSMVSQAFVDGLTYFLWWNHLMLPTCLACSLTQSVHSCRKSVSICQTMPTHPRRLYSPLLIEYYTQKENSVALSPQANWPAEWPPLVGEILVSTLADRGVSCGQSSRSPTVINLSFLDQSHYFSFK
jgi:hypothetical protein